MANIWEHPSVIAEEALEHLEAALVIVPMTAKDKTSDFTTKANGWKVGDTVSFRTHGEYKVDEFTSSISTQKVATSTRPMLIEKHLDVSVELTAREQVLDLDSFSDQIIKPATYELAEYVDAYVGTKLLQGQGAYFKNGVAGDLFGDAADIALARKEATLQRLSMNRFCLCDLDLEASLLGQTWFNQSQTRGGDGESTLRQGEMGRVMGMDFFASIGFPAATSTLQTAQISGAITENTAGTTNLIGDEEIEYSGTVTGALSIGDRIQIAGVKRPLIVKTAIADLSAVTTIALSHPITEVIPDNAAITVMGQHATQVDNTFHGAIMDDRALAVAFPMLDLPEDRVAATATNNGISIRIVKGYDLTAKTTTMSMDLLVGAFALDTRRITLLGEAIA